MTATAVRSEPPIVRTGDLLAPGYRVVGHVSRGEALDVYEVFSESRLCHCVAKTVRPDRAEVERVRDRLLLEGELLRRLAHPHLVRALDTLRDAAGVPVVVLELVPGPTLEELVDSRTRRLGVRDLAHLGRHLCSALQYLHTSGYLHLDVRPANVVARAGVATLIDLSIARPPGPVRRALYEAATAVAPFAPPDDSEPGAGFLQLEGPAPDPRRLGRRLPGPLAALIDQMLSPAPADRPTVLDVHDRLGRLLTA